MGEYNLENITTADMIEIVAAGGNGVEHVDTPALLEMAAKELRESADKIKALRAALDAADDEIEGLRAALEAQCSQ